MTTLILGVLLIQMQSYSIRNSLLDETEHKKPVCYPKALGTTNSDWSL